MSPILRIVRHSQGYHEISKDGNMIHDPAITPHGRDESLALRQRFPYHDNIDLLLSSPMRRALETTLIAFQPPIESRGLRVLAIPSAQEATAEVSDTGSDISTLTALFDHDIDFRYLTPGWNDKMGEMATDVAATKQRARKLRAWIKGRDEKEAVLVSHGRFAHFLTGDVDEHGQQTTGWWVNDEFRSFRFLEGEEDNEGADMIRETEESVLRRQKVEAELEKEEKKGDKTA